MSKQQPRKLSIALCVIARDEEDFIAACLDSARPFVDELIVVDTGSTDRTVEIAREHGARVEFFKWCDDFAAARNATIDAATSDWILMLDADEELLPESGPELREYASNLSPGLLGYAVMIENRTRGGPTDESMHHGVTRFFPRRPSLRYVGAIHEDLVDLTNPTNGQVQSALKLRVAHYGYDPAVYIKRAKDERNTRLLELSLAREPQNDRLLFYLGQQNSVAARYAEAETWFERFADRSASSPRHWLVETYQLWMQTLLKLEQFDKFDRVAERAERDAALSAASREEIAKRELERGNLDVAMRHLQAGLSADAPRGITVPAGSGGWRTRLLLAQVYQALRNPEATLREMELVFEATTRANRAPVAINAAEYALAGASADKAFAWLERAAHAADDNLELQTHVLKLKLRALHMGAPGINNQRPLARIDVALANGDFQNAYDALLELKLGSSEALARLLFLVNELRERQAAEAALDLLARALDAYPPSRQLYWPLMQVLKDLQRFDDALAAGQVLQRLEPVAA